eukprot:6871701-Karenia_brevis.AAC.1
MALGAEMTFQGKPASGRLQQNVSTACNIAKKIAWLPFGFGVRSLVLQAGVLPKALHGAEINL